MSSTAAARRGRTRPLHRFELPAIGGVLVREAINFSSYWRASAFSSTVEPTIYMLAFGFGVGSLVASVQDLRYVEFVGTGAVATAVMFSSAMPSMYSVYVKYAFQHTYDAILAAPVDTEELVTAEILWIAARSAVFGCTPMLVAMIFGLDPSWGMFLVPLIAFLAGFGWAGFGVAVAANLDSIDKFSYVTSSVITPLFLVAGTFFPIDELPEWAQVLSQANPLYHCVELVRHAIFGWEATADLAHLAVIVGFGLITWRLAISGMTRKLID